MSGREAVGERSDNPFVLNNSHMGEITVRQLMEVVSCKPEFPKGLDTVIRIGDVEGNNGVNSAVCLTYHRPGDVVLSIDPNAGDTTYGDEVDRMLRRKGHAPEGGVE